MSSEYNILWNETTAKYFPNAPMDLSYETNNIAKYSMMSKGMSPKQAKQLLRDKDASVWEGVSYAKFLAKDCKASKP